MKKIILLLIVITSSALYVGCTKDEAEPLKLADPLVGEWKFSSKYTKNNDGSTEEVVNPETKKVDNPYVLQTPTSANPLSTCEMNKKLQFGASGTYEYSYGTTAGCTAVNGNYVREFSNKYKLTPAGGSQTYLYTTFNYYDTQLVTFENVTVGTTSKTVKTVYERIIK